MHWKSSFEQATAMEDGEGATPPRRRRLGAGLALGVLLLLIGTPLGELLPAARASADQVEAVHSCSASGPGAVERLWARDRGTIDIYNNCSGAPDASCSGEIY